MLIELDVLLMAGRLSDWLKPERSLPAVGFLSGFLLLLWQLDRQHRGALIANASQERQRLGVEIYRDLSEVSEQASKAIVEYLSLVADTVLDAGEREKMLTAQRSRPEGELVRQQQAASSAATHVLARLEKWEIALAEDFNPLRSSVSAHVDELQIAARVFAGAAAAFFDSSRQGPIAELLHEHVAKEGERAQRAAWAIATDLHLLRIATQRRLLGGLFPGHTGPGFRPIAPFDLATLREIVARERSR